jgi:hypothetical protein
MAQVQFDDIDGEIHVFAQFATGHQVIGFGDAALEQVLAHIWDDHQFEIKLIYNNMRSSELSDYTLKFEFLEDDSPFVTDLTAIVDGHERHLGSYFVFAEGGGADGLLQW